MKYFFFLPILLFGEPILEQFENATAGIILYDGKIEHAKELDSTLPIDPSIFQIDLFAMMIDQKRATWEDHVINHFSEFQLSDDWITRQFLIEDLFTMKSGLPKNALQPLKELGYHDSDIIKALKYIPFTTPFRRDRAPQFCFNAIAGKILEKWNRKPWYEVLRENLFKPLEMTSTNICQTTLRDLSKWLLLHMDRKSPYISESNLIHTHKTAWTQSENQFIQETPNFKISFSPKEKSGYILYYDINEKTTTPTHPENPERALSLKHYTGLYTNPIFGTISITKEGENLSLRIGPKSLKLELYPWDGDQFMAYKEGESYYLVTFDLDSENLNFDQLGEFSH